MKDLFKETAKVIAYRPVLWFYRLIANAWAIYVKTAYKFSSQVIDDETLRDSYKSWTDMLDYLSDDFDYWNTAEAKTYGVTVNACRITEFYAKKHEVTLES